MTERIVRYLTQGQTQALLTWPEVISCIAAAYARAEDPRAAPPKVVARSGGTWLRALTASARDSAIPVLLGGHTLVGPGVRLLLGARR